MSDIVYLKELQTELCVIFFEWLYMSDIVYQKNISIGQYYLFFPPKKLCCLASSIFNNVAYRPVNLYYGISLRFYLPVANFRVFYNVAHTNYTPQTCLGVPCLTLSVCLFVRLSVRIP